MQININIEGINVDAATTNPVVALITSVTATMIAAKVYNLSIMIQIDPPFNRFTDAFPASTNYSR
uniref:hypothetical protein n=1 Tax=Rhodococcoides fascians TaxID=1828 RepID=UPI00155D9857|nr:hypothetical protein [Rhodococcus fascians]